LENQTTHKAIESEENKHETAIKEQLQWFLRLHDHEYFIPTNNGAAMNGVFV